MRCSGCGQPLEADTTVCLRCGTPVPSDIVVPDAPSEDRPSVVGWPSLGAFTSPYGNYATAEAPPPPLYYSGGGTYGATAYPMPLRRWERWRVNLAVGVFATLVLALGFSALGYAYAHNLKSAPSTMTGTGQLGNTLLDGTNCQLPHANPTAAANLANAQLTSGLRDEADGNYEPIDNKSAFAVGQTVFNTFTVATDASANVVADWCWGKLGQTASFTLYVTHDRNVTGYFKLNDLSSEAVGEAVLVIRWNQVPAYVITFSVTQASPTPTPTTRPAKG